MGDSFGCGYPTKPPPLFLFKLLSCTQASEFVSVANDSLVDRSSALIVFSRATGRVFYNSNDTETNSYPDPIKFAKLVGITHLSAADFTLI